MTPTPLGTVAMPANGLRMTPEALVDIIRAQIEDNDVDLIVEPSPELVAAWKRGEDGDVAGPQVCRGWIPWGPLCLVCHYEVPEGQATVYAHLTARVCMAYCSDLVKGLERVQDRSSRGRWRPTGQVRAMANGALCNACMDDSEAVR